MPHIPGMELNKNDPQLFTSSDQIQPGAWEMTGMADSEHSLEAWRNPCTLHQHCKEQRQWRAEPNCKLLEH